MRASAVSPGSAALGVLLAAVLAAPAHAAPLPWAPPPVNICGEVGFDPLNRLPDPAAPPAPPLPPSIDIPIPVPLPTPVPVPDPPHDNTRVAQTPLPMDPCRNPCPEVRDTPEPDSDGGEPMSTGSAAMLPRIQIRPEIEPIPIPVPGGAGDPPQDAPEPVVRPIEPGPVHAPVAPTGVEFVRLVEQVTGPGSANRTDMRWQVDGTDLGLFWETEPGKVAMVFGDTFGEGWVYGGAGADTADWRSNALAFSTDTDLSDGLTIDSMVQDSPCHAAELLGSRKIKNWETTTIPTSGFALGERQFMSYMSVNHWSRIPGMWLTNYGGLAYSDDGGQTWTKDQHAKWENMFGLGRFQVAAMVPRGDYVYMFGTPNGRVGMIGLARVHKKDVLNKTAYQYWVDGSWAPAAQNSATPLVLGTASELSVRFDAETGQWQMVYLDAAAGQIVLRTAAEPQGAWTSAVPLVSTEDYPRAYGGFIHPWSTARDLYFTMSAWDSYNVYLMHARLHPPA